MHLLLLHPPNQLRSGVHLLLSNLRAHQHGAIRISLWTESACALQHRTQPFAWTNSEWSGVYHFSSHHHRSADIIPAGVLRDSEYVSVAQKFIFSRVASGD